MPLFMDMHGIDAGVTASDAAAAHQADLATRAGYGANYLRYWLAGEAGKFFCLVEAHLTQRQPTPFITRPTGSSLTTSTWSANTPRRRDR